MPMPDANLHPVATGLAKETVGEHAAEQPLKLFAGWFCPFVQRVWLALEEKGIPYQYIKGEQLMKANPRGLVPTLEVAPGKALYESTVLLQYLEETYPHRAPRLLPPVAGDEGDVVQDHEAVFTRARARIWMDFVTTRVIPAWHRLLQFQAGTQRGNKDNSSKQMLEGMRDEYRGYLIEFARAMDPEGPFFFAGDEIGMVDIAIAPWVLRHWVFDHFKGVTAVPEPGQAAGEKDDEAAWARFRKWRAAVESRDSVKRTESEREHYLPIYQRYADDTAQSEMAKASRSGRGVP
ncbi:hypothetical protein PG984_000265 [Apiospora sp. TS-2023a]